MDSIRGLAYGSSTSLVETMVEPWSSNGLRTRVGGLLWSGVDDCWQWYKSSMQFFGLSMVYFG